MFALLILICSLNWVPRFSAAHGWDKGFLQEKGWATRRGAGKGTQKSHAVFEHHRVGVVLKGHGFCARINHPHAESTSGASVYPRPDTAKGWGCPDSGFVPVHGELVTEWDGR